MKINTKFSVAIHILLILEFKKGKVVCSQLISDSVNTNPVVIRKILAMLKAAGFIDTKRGAGGSFGIKDIEEITLLDVYKAVEIEPDGELFNFHRDRNMECPIASNIEASVVPVLKRSQNAMEEELSKVTIKDVFTDVKNRIDISKEDKG